MTGACEKERNCTRFTVHPWAADRSAVSPDAAIRQQSAQLRLAQVPPFAHGQRAQFDVDDAHPLQAADLVAEHGAHAPDLPVEALGEHDAEGIGAHFPGAAGLGAHLQLRQVHAGTHAADEARRQRPVHRHHVFLLVIVLGAQDLVDDIAVAGEQNQTVGFLVQTPDGKDALAVADEVHDIAAHMPFRGAGDAHRLVERDVDASRLMLGLAHAALHRLAVDADLILLADLLAQLHRLAVDRDAPGGDERIGLAARAQAGFADVFVEAQKNTNLC